MKAMVSDLELDHQLPLVDVPGGGTRLVQRRPQAAKKILSGFTIVRIFQLEELLDGGIQLCGQKQRQLDRWRTVTAFDSDDGLPRGPHQACYRVLAELATLESKPSEVWLHQLPQLPAKT